MKAFINFAQIFGLLLLLNACGSSDGKQNPVIGNWEITQSDRTYYVIFTEDTLTALFLSEEFQCYFKLEENIFYTSKNTIESERGLESEFIIDDNQLIIDPNTDEPIIYSASLVDLNALTYCENPAISGDIKVEIEFADFAEMLRSELANPEQDYSYNLDVFLDMDNDNTRSVNDIEFGVYYDSEFNGIQNPSISQLGWNISIITKTEESTTYYETIAFPETTFDSANKTITFTIPRGAIPSFNNISLSSDIGVKASTYFGSMEGSLYDSFPDTGQIEISNLSGSEDNIDDTFGSGEYVNLMDIKSVSIAITE